jgi:hypothetical protein
VPTARSGRLRDREDRADENMAMSSVAAPLDQTFPPDSGGGHQLRPIGDSRQTWDTGSKAAGLSVDTPASLPNGTCSRLATATGPPPHPHPPLPDSIANAGWLLWPTWEDMNAFGAPGAPTSSVSFHPPFVHLASRLASRSHQPGGRFDQAMRPDPVGHHPLQKQ